MEKRMQMVTQALVNPGRKSDRRNLLSGNEQIRVGLTTTSSRAIFRQSECPVVERERLRADDEDEDEDDDGDGDGD